MNIGDFQKAKAQETRQQVLDYFTLNPFAEQRECAADLSIHVMTVSRHYKALRAEWINAREGRNNG
jgi:predicted transcriptional regulator